MNENFVTNKGWFFNRWLKRSSSPGAQAWRELEAEGFFKPFYFYFYGYRKEIFAFDLENGVFFHCQEQGTTQNDRLVTMVEYELYGGYYINNNLKYSMILDWKFHLACLPLLSIRLDDSLYNLNYRFFTTLHARNQGVVDATRKPGYHEWREKMKRKGWLIDREVDNQIMAQRRGEQVLEIVPLEELEGTSDMQGR
ncbi:hypothetical protein WKI72_22850 (plasmid) [Candidatus Erwinia dacicola]|uniref:Uncharacterized protein n=4 Tax=Candidatus Erwinia dacicola TaxID=252393 RepID=A0A1E7Z4U5_9GAMM|nr:hypothetical protein [Candidatus Erwinia dacicola]OFC63754.1 hypothetical protein BBW68_04100 [Candidatus Erwinia dacicola]